MKRTFLLLAGLCLATATPAAADEPYPSRPIHMIVPYGPGGQFGLHARLLADKMKESLGQPVLIENKPGAMTTLGAAYVAQSKNDGYTLLFSGANALALAPHQMKDLSYKVADFQPITMVSVYSLAFMINSQAIPAKTLAEFVTYVKANPGKLSYGTSGTGGNQHIMGEHLKEMFGLDITQVGYRGSPEIATDLLSGQLAMAVDGMMAYMPYMAPDGPLRTFAINASQRIEVAPDVPTFEELGYPQMTANSWGGVLAPAGTPPAVVDKLYQAIVEANKLPEIRDLVVRSAGTPLTTTPAEFQRIIDEDSRKWGEMIQRLGIKAQ